MRKMQRWFRIAALTMALTGAFGTFALWQRLTQIPVMQMLDLETGKAGQFPDHWYGDRSGFVVLDNKVRFTGEHSARLTGGGPKEFRRLFSEIDLAKEVQPAAKPKVGGKAMEGNGPGKREAAGEEVTLQAYLKAEDVTGMAGLFVASISATGKELTFATREFDGVQGRQDWKLQKVTVKVPAGTKTLRFGCVLRGGGTVWVDTFQVVPMILPAVQGQND